jgi:hypothetical protein
MLDDEGFVVDEDDIASKAPKAVDISEKVDMSKGEGNVVAEKPETTSLPEAPKAAKKTIILVSTPAPTTSQAGTKERNNTAVEEWIRPGASNYVLPSTLIENLKDRYSPDYSGYKIVVIFSRFELPKEHNIFSKYDDVDIYTTADGNKLYMVGAHNSKKKPIHI